MSMDGLDCSLGSCPEHSQPGEKPLPPGELADTRLGCQEGQQEVLGWRGPSALQVQIRQAGSV